MCYLLLEYYHDVFVVLFGLFLCSSPFVVVFVSPELSSGRDLVNQMSVCSVRRPPSASVIFCPEHFSGMTYLDDIWYVGEARAEVAHAEFWGWHMLIKYLVFIIYAKICPEHFSGTVCPTWMIFGMWVGLGPKVRMVTFMEIKGHQRSNGVNYVLWPPYLDKMSADASWKWKWPLWRSKVIRSQMGSTMCYGYHI